MQVGLVGLGRMGSGIRERLTAGGHQVVGYDLDPTRADVDSLEALVARLEPPRAVWVMVPAAEVDAAVASLATLLSEGDLLVDGGNSHYRDSQRRAAAAAEGGVEYVDLGVSGGIHGARDGYCLMAGGATEAVARLAPLFDALAVEGGWAHVGPSGAGHYVKMVHNGIEYGLMQAYAEGFELLDAYDEPLDLPAIAHLWDRGSVVRSWLLGLAARALARDPRLESLRGYVQDSGEGRWTVQEAVARSVPANVIAASLFARFASRQDDSLAMRLLAALRNEFGGHDVTPRP